MTRFEEYYRDHFERIYRFAFRFVGDAQAAKDITQEAFVKLYDHVKNDRELSNPKAWLYIVASNLCKNRIKRSGFMESMADEKGRIAIEEKTPEVTLIRSEDHRRLRHVLNRLNYEDQLLLQLYQDDFSYLEISEIAKIKVTSVGKKLSRAIARCRNEFLKD